MEKADGKTDEANTVVINKWECDSDTRSQTWIQTFIRFRLDYAEEMWLLWSSPIY